MLLMFFLSLSYVGIMAINQQCNDKNYCPSNSQCLPNGYCSCIDNYVGDCSTQAILLSQIPQPFNITNQFSFFRMQTNTQGYIIYQFNICGENSEIKVAVNLWIDNGQVQKLNENNAMGTNKVIENTEGCNALLSPFFKFDSQPNGLPQMLIFGIQLITNTSESITITLSVEQDEIFGLEIFFRAMLILLGCLFLAVIAAVVYCVFMYRRRRRNYSQRVINDLSFFESNMPEVPYVNSSNPQVCPICLIDFQPGVSVRKTFCNHVFHSQCLKSWCQNRLSCPVCRTELTQDNLERFTNYSLLNDENDDNHKMRQSLISN